MISIVVQCIGHEMANDEHSCAMQMDCAAYVKHSGAKHCDSFSYDKHSCAMHWN